MAEDEQDENVVELFGPEPTRPAVITTPNAFHRQMCSHKNIELDAEQRICVCRKCGCRIEPFDWLVEHAGRPWRRAWDNYKHIRSERSRIEGSLKELKRELKNLKAQVGRWREKLKRIRREVGEDSVSWGAQRRK